jgi:hypothetical protein
MSLLFKDRAYAMQQAGDGWSDGVGWLIRWMKYVYGMQNMTFGAEGGLMKACQEKHSTEPWLCFMSPHMQDVIETPFFMYAAAFPPRCRPIVHVAADLAGRCSSWAGRCRCRFNSKYDAWQLGNEFQSNWVTKEEQAGVLQYGKDFMEQLAPVYTPPESKNGGMITSCICHGCPWSDLKLAGKSSYQHYADWFYSKTKGAESMHIDPSLPNGNGTLQGGAFKGCKAFPDAEGPAEAPFISML